MAPLYDGAMATKPPDDPSEDQASEVAAGVPDTSPEGAAAQPHDALFRQIFGDPVHAAAVLRTILPPRVAAHIDWSTPFEPTHASMVGESSEQHHGDLVFKVKLIDGRDAFVWVLFEHQSWPWRVRHPHRMKPRRVRGRGDTGGARTEEVGLNGWPARGRYVTWCHEPVPELDREPHEHPILLPCGPRPREHAL